MAYSFNTPFGEVHQGSWFGLPDFGLTERAPATWQNRVGDPLQQQPQQTPPPYQPPVTPQPQQPAAPYQPVYNPQPQPQQQQQQQQQSGNFMDYYQGWNPDAARNDFQQAFGNDINRLMQSRGFGGGGSQGPSILDQINDIYSPIMSGLSQQEDVLRQGAATELGGMQLKSQQALQDAVNEAANANQIALSQKGEIKQNQMSAADEAKRQFLALQQQARSRYGASSSMGPAVQELAAQEYYRQMGKLDQYQVAEIGKIQNYERQVNDNYKLKVARVHEATDQYEKELQQKLNEGLLTINNQKNQIESAKAQQKLGILQETANQIKQLDTYKQQLLMSLAGQKAMTDYQLTTGIYSIVNPNAPSAGKPTAMNIPQLGGGYQSVYEQAYTPRTNTLKKDEFGNIINF